MTFRCGTVAIAGRPNTGKSSLLNKLVGQKIAIVSPKAQTTRRTVTGIFTTPSCQFVFVDLPGYQTRHVNVLNRALNRQATEGARDCDVAVFVVEALRYGTEDREVLARIPQEQRVVLALNKIDLVKNRLELLPFIEQVQKERAFAAIVPVSSSSHGSPTSGIATPRRWRSRASRPSKKAEICRGKQPWPSLC